MKKNTAASLGNVALAVSVGGLVATELALRDGWVAAPGWKILQQTFEAATVGGLADWFAVSALFREVPVPIIRRHTNIIIKNRQRIVAGIADMVQNRWLAPHIIREHLVHFSASQYFLDFFADEKHLESVLAMVRDVMRQLARGITAEEAAPFLERTLKERLQNIQIAARSGAGWGGACAAATITVCGIRCSRSPKRRCRGRRRRRSCSERSRARSRVTKEGGG